MAQVDVLLDSATLLGDRLETNLLFLVSDRVEPVEKLLELTDLPAVVATSEDAVEEAASDRVRAVLRLSDPLSGSFNILGQLKDILLGAYVEGTVSAGDEVLVLVSNADSFDIVLNFSVDQDLELTELRGAMADHADIKVLERILRLASDLSREGREGKTLGTLFVIGDSKNVMNHSRQILVNPFQGHLDEDRDILREEMTETVKEFAQLDGAFIVDGSGRIEAAGRYIETDRTVEVQSGLGGRHLAAASITKVTDAVAVAVSSSGAVRIFKDGEVLMRVGRF